MISQEKWMILTPLQKLPKNVEDLGKLIVAKGLKKLPKVQKITQSGHTDTTVLQYIIPSFLFHLSTKSISLNYSNFDIIQK